MGPQTLDSIESVIPAAVIHKNEAKRRFAQESLKLIHRQSKAFVVARHHHHASRFGGF
jgi:hypothetical protein